MPERPNARILSCIVAGVLLLCGLAQADSLNIVYLDQSVQEPAPTISMQARASSAAWTVDTMTFTVDGANYAATIQR